MLPKTGKKFPDGNDTENGSTGYAAIVAGALRAELGETHRAAKVVMRWTGASERTVKHWLAGAHGPCGGHLLVLMRESEAFFEAILNAVNRRDAVVAARILATQRAMVDVAALIQREQAGPQTASALAVGARGSAATRGQDDRENDRNHDRDHDRETTRSDPSLNPRQNWFLETLQAGSKIGAAELVERWGVSDKTARRDVATLKARGLIEFVGSRRSGGYRPAR